MKSLNKFWVGVGLELRTELVHGGWLRRQTMVAGGKLTHELLSLGLLCDGDHMWNQQNNSFHLIIELF